MYPHPDPVHPIDVAYEEIFLELTTQWKRYDFHAMSDAQRRAAAMLVHGGAAELRIRCRVEVPSTQHVLRAVAVVSGTYLTSSHQGQVLVAELRKAARCLEGWNDVPGAFWQCHKTALRITAEGENARMDYQAGIPGALWSFPGNVPGQVVFERMRIDRPADAPTGTQTSAQAIAVASIGDVMVNVPPPTVVIASAEQDSRKGHGDKEEQQPLLQVARWSDLAIGIDGQWEFWAMTPPPQRGGPFKKESAHELHLNGRRWRALLQALAESESGDCCQTATLVRELDYLPPPSSLPRDGRVRRDSLESEFGRDLRIGASAALRRLKGAVKDLARELREQISGPKGQRWSTALRVDGETVRSGFVVGFLLPDEQGHLFFRRLPS